MAKLSEKHPREAEIAKKLLAEFRFSGNEFYAAGSVQITRERADELEMKICEALVDARAVGFTEQESA